MADTTTVPHREGEEDTAVEVEVAEDTAAGAAVDGEGEEAEDGAVTVTTTTINRTIIDAAEVAEEEEDIIAVITTVTTTKEDRREGIGSARIIIINRDSNTTEIGKGRRSIGLCCK